MSIKSAVTALTKMAALIIAVVALSFYAEAATCIYHQDNSVKGTDDPCSYTQWYLYATTINQFSQQVGGSGGVLSIGNGCTGQYTDCAGNLNVGQFFHGSKQMVWWESWESPGYVEFYWNITHRGVYMDQCTIPGRHNPVPTSLSGIYGWIRLYCD